MSHSNNSGLGRVLVGSCAAASILMLAACGSSSHAAGGSSVNAGSLYQGGGGASQGAATGAFQPVVSNDPSIPPGQTGELVPGVAVALGATTPQQKLVLNTAYYFSVKRCMSQQGFTLLDPAPKLELPNYGPVLFDGYIGILDADYAQKYGYQFDPAAMQNQNQGRQQVTGDPSYENALKVSGNGGCDGQAQRMIEANVPTEDQSTPILSTIYQSSLNATYSDPAYKQAVQAWSACMSRSGFNYATPSAAFGAYKGFQLTPAIALHPTAPHPSSVEVDTALADVNCKRSSRLADVFRQVFWSHQLAMAALNRPTLKVLDDIKTLKLRNAQRMIKELG